MTGHKPFKPFNLSAQDEIAIEQIKLNCDRRTIHITSNRKIKNVLLNNIKRTVKMQRWYPRNDYSGILKLMGDRYDSIPLFSLKGWEE